MQRQDALSGCAAQAPTCAHRLRIMNDYGSTGTTRIALVDDDESVRRALTRLLRAEGFEVVSHASGAELLESLQRSEPHCIVLDLHMPELDGFSIQTALTK